MTRLVLENSFEESLDATMLSQGINTLISTLKKHTEFNNKNRKRISRWFALIGLISTTKITNPLHLTIAEGGGGGGGGPN